MDGEHTALIALLRARPAGLSWRELTEQVLEQGSSRQVWDMHFPAQLMPIDDPERHLRSAEDDLHAWERGGLEFLSVLDRRFPARLRDIQETPPFLFAQGKVVPDDEGVSVVGSRQATPRGLRIAHNIATSLAQAGISVIAGLAAGIDTAAHAAALDVGARTVAFIGTGSHRTYPAENRALHRQIAGTGVVLSRFWPDAPPQKHTFLMRNALMSGYGIATIVVEAGEHSGARAQARMAVEHGRPVILTDLVVATTDWGKQLADHPGVWVAEGTQDIADIIGSLRQVPTRLDEALVALTRGA
ncbi:DNA-processing protein DprA [Nocardia wallacei]|uniref:DNA-processing protein DprA n=1 Tax=Nocardia wallacei TaxID=480035 RepID=UPI00245515D0|nr:DNA-processing protein DprA [Nocardia wallacei]